MIRAHEPNKPLFYSEIFWSAEGMCSFLTFSARSCFVLLVLKIPRKRSIHSIPVPSIPSWNVSNCQIIEGTMELLWPFWLNG